MKRDLVRHVNDRFFVSMKKTSGLLLSHQGVFSALSTSARSLCYKTFHCLILFGPSMRLMHLNMASADFSLRSSRRTFIHKVRSPRVMRTSFTLITVTYTNYSSVSVLDFSELCHLTRIACLLCASCSSV